MLAALCVVAAVESGADAVAAAAFGMAVVSWTWGWQLRRLRQHVQFLPLLRRILPLVSFAGTLTAILALIAVGVAGGVDVAWALVVASAAAAVTALDGLLRRRARRRALAGGLRVAVIGSAGLAEDLGGELRSLGRSDVTVAGWIAPSEHADLGEGEPGVLGRLGSLATIIGDHGIDLLLLSDEAPRMAFFDELAETCSSSGVRVQELNAFYEHAFGHVAVGRINAAWFQWVMHPRYKVGTPAPKRALDLLVATAVSIVALPLIAILALVIRRDGGPAFFSQQRVGEHGREFRIHKLRTMSTEGASQTAWTAEDDARVTRVGRLLRRTHLDELPQLINLFRGEMSVVGPRPEQPAYVAQLEQTVPHYSRRNIARPGVTGWAQVKCGYAGSDSGSTWKLSHDLYYLKHRSMGLDLLVLGETLRTLVADRQFDQEFRLPAFVARSEARSELSFAARAEAPTSPD